MFFFHTVSRSLILNSFDKKKTSKITNKQTQTLKPSNIIYYTWTQMSFLKVLLLWISTSNSFNCYQRDDITFAFTDWAFPLIVNQDVFLLYKAFEIFDFDLLLWGIYFRWMTISSERHNPSNRVSVFVGFIINF